MGTTRPTISRISKLLIDRDQLAAEDALALRKDIKIVLVCGPDVAESYTLQVAVLTAARLGQRCFPGAVQIHMDAPTCASKCLAGSGGTTSFGGAVQQIIGLAHVSDLTSAPCSGTGVLFGKASAGGGFLRATFDGWIAKVGPANRVERLKEREFCPLAGVLVGALSISEIFLQFARVSIEAGRRTIALSLWRPDIDPAHADAVGVPLEQLPANLWVLGLGHLGNAYLWALATLPYANPEEVTFHLLDFDKVEDANVETGILFEEHDLNKRKTRICSSWLEELGFQTAIIERQMDDNFRRRSDEPATALCGFDSNKARRFLETAQFRQVVESGLGGKPGNFDTINMHTWPNPRSAEDIWPEDPNAELVAERLAEENPAYKSLAGDHCGRVDVAGKSIAVPFVGAAAATLVVADLVRRLNGGKKFTDVRLQLGIPSLASTIPSGGTVAEDLVGIEFTDAFPMKI